jgi:ABC-type uncharacterized transport system involved in gliding motility auxiliary subunit
VEQPARLALDARSIIREWTPSNRRAFVLLAVLAVISALSGYANYVRTGDVRWLMGNAPASANRELMHDWGLLERDQTAIGLSAAGMFAWPIVLPA